MLLAHRAFVVRVTKAISVLRFGSGSMVRHALKMGSGEGNVVGEEDRLWSQDGEEWWGL